MNNEEYNLILKENNRRIFILKNYYEQPNWLSEYDNYRDSYINYTSKIVQRLSFSNAFIRKYFLNDDTIKLGNYYLSNLRINYYNGYKGETNNAESIFNLMNDIDLRKEVILFFTVDFTISNEFDNVGTYLKNLKSIYKKFLQTNAYNLITGLIIKYEVAYSLYKGCLFYIPHSHLLIKCDSINKDNVVNDLIKYLNKYIGSIWGKPCYHYKEITYNQMSYNKLASYISKDFYYSIFHYKDRLKNIDSFIVPQPHIITLLYNVQSFQCFSSYKDFRFKVYWR